MKPLRVVVDPNLLISMLIGGRVSALTVIFDHTDFLLLVSQTALDEFEKVARRSKFRKYFPEDVVDSVVINLRNEAVFVKLPDQYPAICRDPNDDYLLALSKAGKADVLLTGDDDLLVMGEYGRTRIMNARAFVKEFLSRK